MDPKWIAVHTSMAGLQLAAFIVVLMIRTKAKDACLVCPSASRCARNSAVRGWTFMAAAVFGMFLRRVSTGLVLSGLVPGVSGRWVAWVFLPTCISVLMVMGLFDILLCEMTKSSNRTLSTKVPTSEMAGEEGKFESCGGCSSGCGGT